MEATFLAQNFVPIMFGGLFVLLLTDCTATLTRWNFG